MVVEGGQGLCLYVKRLAQIRAGLAGSGEEAGRLQAFYQATFGRAAGLNELAGLPAAEASTAPPGAAFTVHTAGGQVLATADACTLVAEAATYLVLSGGLTPTLTASDGTVLSFVNASAFLSFALGLARRDGMLTPALAATYGLTDSWLNQIGQADLQAASRLHALVGQWQVSVTLSGDSNDASGLAGFSYTVTDTDPVRTALIAQARDAQAQAGAAQTGAAQTGAAQTAGNALLAFLDGVQARVDVAYAALPPGARTDKMLGVAQQFVSAGQQAAAGNWNLVQTLETAADVSLQIAAQPEGSRTKLTEWFMHKDVKHDITVDPNAADPFASFSDHSKGEDVIGSIVEAVVGVVINILAVIPVTAPIAAPLAVAWDTAQVGKNFAEGNVLGGVLSLASAVGVGLSGLGAIAVNGVGASAGSFASEAGQLAESTAVSLEFTADVGVAGGVMLTRKVQDLAAKQPDTPAAGGGAGGTQGSSSGSATYAFLPPATMTDAVGAVATVPEALVLVPAAALVAAGVMLGNQLLDSGNGPAPTYQALPAPVGSASYDPAAATLTLTPARDDASDPGRLARPLTYGVDADGTLRDGAGTAVGHLVASSVKPGGSSASLSVAFNADTAPKVMGNSG